MKKHITYTGILAVGLLLGWLLFGNSSNEKEVHNHNEAVETNQMWTCSMHPKIMQQEAGDCPICGMDLIPSEAGADGLAADQFKLSENALALANIQTTIVSNKKTEDNTIIVSGKIVENEEANAVQVSYFSGRIESLNVSSTGEEVHKGQLLATVYSPELYAAQQELITAASLKESQPELYKAVRNKLKIWKLSDNQVSQIEKTGKVKEIFNVYATVSGTVTEKLVEQGDYIKQGQPLLKIANLNTVWANFDVYENQISLFKKGQNIEIYTNAHPNKKIKGKVSFISPVLNTQTRTVALRAVLNNKKAFFKPGMFVKGHVTLTKKGSKKSLTIPASALLWTGKRSVVYVKIKTNEPVFEMREVSLGNRQGENYEISDGLISGDEIVANGAFTVDAAAQLQGKKSMMNKVGGKVKTGHEGHLGMDNSYSSKESDHANISERLEAPKAFQQQLNKVYDSYINLKNALVRDDTNKGSKDANNLLDNLAQVDMKLIKDKAHNHWMSLAKEIKSSTTEILKTTDIKEQRNHFKHLSSHLINTVQLFGINEKVYVEFCPMADSNNGAYWLSKEEKVINPYFGDAMLTCGEVKQVIE